MRNTLMRWVAVGMGPMMRWEDLYDELYDADDRAEIARLKDRLLSELKAHRLAQARKNRGLTQRDVAAVMGVSVGRVSQIERGEVASVEVGRDIRHRARVWHEAVW